MANDWRGFPMPLQGEINKLHSEIAKLEEMEIWLESEKEEIEEMLKQRDEAWKKTVVELKLVELMQRSHPLVLQREKEDENYNCFETQQKEKSDKSKAFELMDLMQMRPRELAQLEANNDVAWWGEEE